MTAAAQDGAEKVRLNIGFILKCLGIRLGHLADFFVKCHLREQRLDLPIIIRRLLN